MDKDSSVSEAIAKAAKGDLKVRLDEDGHGDTYIVGDGFSVRFTNEDYTNREESWALFGRLIDCANACEGMKDPATEIQNLRQGCKPIDPHASDYRQQILDIANAHARHGEDWEDSQ